MRKLFVAFVAGWIMLGAGMFISTIANQIAPGLEKEYQNPQIFRAWSDPIMSLYWVVPFLSAFMMMYIWNFSKSNIKGDTFVRRGFSFAFMFWLVSIPGMIMSYSSFQLSFAMILSWTSAGFLEAVCAGVIFARFLP